MEYRYVVTSQKFQEVPGLGVLAKWTAIPKDHHDANIRRYYPGSFFKEEKSKVVFIFPERKK